MLLRLVVTIPSCPLPLPLPPSCPCPPACSVMDTFVHDPLVDWARGGSSGGGRANDEGTDNPHAKDALATIEGGCLLHECFC